MAALTGRKPGISYPELLKLSTSSLTGSLQRVQDGSGNDTPISLSTTAVDLNSTKISGVANPTLAQDVATKNYVDTADGLLLSKSGGIMTGDITLVGNPSNDLHAATKQYVDTVAAGLDPKNPVRVATTANITLSGLQTIDGVTLIAGDRILVKNQTTATQNGIYVVASGSWSRATDADGTPADEVSNGNFVLVSEGTTLGGTGWTITSPAGDVNIGVDNIVWTQFHQANETTATNVGTGTGLVFRNKTGTVINLKTMKAGTNVTVTNNTDDVTFDLATTINVTGNVVVGGQAYSSSHSLGTTSGTVNIDWNNGNVQIITLNGAFTLGTSSNHVSGAKYILIVKQDATGSRTGNFSSSTYKFPGGTEPTLSTGANAVDIISFVSDGTNMYGVSQLNFS